MSILSIPNVFVTGTTIQAAPFNANFSAVQTAVNSIDNTNIGVAGLFASQILPTTSGQATFGGTTAYTFPYGVGGTGVFTAQSTSTVPMTVNGITSQAVDLFDVYLTAGGSKDFWISSNGNVHVASGITLNVPLTAPATGVVALSNDNATTNGMLFNVPTGSTNGFSFDVNGSSVASISAAGLGTFATLKATGAISAGSATAGTATAGDLWASRTASTGALNFGGSTSSAAFDWNATNANEITLTVTGGAPVLALGATGTGSLYAASAQFTLGVSATGGFAPGNKITQLSPSPAIYAGNGAPTFSALNGSIYMRFDGTPGTNVLYTNTTGASSTGTSWTPHF
jgi:hypothetical protein